MLSEEEVIPETEDEEEHMATSSSAGQKRPGNADSTGSPAKQPRQGGKNRLPGTAKGQGGQENGSVEGGPRDFALPHPTNDTHSTTRYFRKVHRFITWGIAYDVINVRGSTGEIDWQWMSTPLAHVPWEYPYFYLNPAEFRALPEGSTVRKIKIQIIPRNVRIAFPTNSTASNLATLNQNKDIIVAQGLNIYCHSFNKFYSGFNTEQPMIPTTFQSETTQIHGELRDDLYGSILADKTEYSSTVPRHQMGIPTPLPLYAMLSLANLTAYEQTGWPCLQMFYEDFDADMYRGRVVKTFEYEPSIGLIKPPVNTSYPYFPVGGVRPATLEGGRNIVVHRGSHNFDKHRSKYYYRSTNDDVSRKMNPQRKKDIADDMRGKENQNINHIQFIDTDPIEKSQVIMQGNYQSQPPRVQPTVHIGIQPVPALTTAALAGQSNSAFTDSSAYFEIIAEMWVETGYPTMFPLSDRLVMTENGNTFFIASDVPKGYDMSTYDGLYGIESNLDD